MPARPYNAKLLQRARELRVNATKQERKLWYEFLREFRPRFTRQRIVGSYILDFYCGKAKLAIELDGSQHYESESVKYDKIRTKYLEALGIKVMRFANTDVINSFEGVCGEITKEVAAIMGEQPPPSADGTPFVREGGKEEKTNWQK
jgi:very-short-patch-repair endonuclease